MTIQLLTFPGCPNADTARQALQRALERAELPCAFEEIDTSSAGCPEHLRGWGSATILVDGRDVAGAEAATGSCCRLYAGSGDRQAPSEELILAAIARA